MRKIPRIVKGLTVFSGMALAFAWQAQGVDRTWSNTLGGDFTNSANWVGGNVPGALDNANFLSNASYEVTLSTSVTNANAYFNASGGTVALNTGSGSLYYVTLFKVPNNNTVGDASVDFTSGNVSAYKVFVGDPNAFNAHRMTVSNPGTTLTTRGDDITVGVNGSGNLFYVTNSALVACGRTVYAGYAATSSNNTVVVSGTGTRLIANTSVMIGRSSVNNRLIVEDGAEVVCSNSSLSVGENIGADWNSVIVRSGSVLTNGNGVSYVGRAGANNKMTISNSSYRPYANLNVGDSGSFNQLEVLDGGSVLARTHLYMGNAAASQYNTVVVSGSNTILKTASYDVNVGHAGRYNTLLVTNGAEVAAYRSVYVGTINGSSDNQIIVSGTNTVLRSNFGLGGAYSIAVGKVGTNNTLRLEDGATFVGEFNVNNGAFSLGAVSGTLNNGVFVGSGCMVTNLGTVFVGEYGDSNSLTLSNATFYAGGYSHVGYGGANNSMTVCGGARYLFSGHCHVGYNTNAIGNTLTVTGSGTIMTNQNYDLDVGFKGSGNRMRVADGAEVRIVRSIFVGHNAGATNNVMEIEGGTLRSLQAYISGTQTMMVSNACTLAVYGSNSVVQAKTLQIIGGSSLAIRVGKEGFTPIAVSGALTFDDTTRLAVDAFTFAKEGGGTLTLLTYGSKNQEVLAQNITLSPAGSTLNQSDGNSITIRVPSLRGTIISIY